MSYRPSQKSRDPADDLQDLARQIEDLRVEPRPAVTSAGSARSQGLTVKFPDKPVSTQRAPRGRIPSPPPRPRKALEKPSVAGRGRTVDANPLTSDKNANLTSMAEGERFRASQQRDLTQLTPCGRGTTPEARYESSQAPVPAEERFVVVIDPELHHSVMWDPVDGGVLPWAGTICVYDYEPSLCTRDSGPVRDVQISFHLVVPPARTNVDVPPCARPDEWRVSYTGLRDVSKLSAEQGIAVERIEAEEELDEDGALIWHVPFWVPVPNALFARAEYRTFVCCAAVTVGDECTPDAVVRAGDVRVGIDRLRTREILEAARLSADRG